MSIVPCPIGTLLLPLVDESHIPVHGCILSVLSNFSNQDLPITDLEVPVSQSVDTLLSLIKFGNLLSICHLCEFGLFHYLGALYSEIRVICGKIGVTMSVCMDVFSSSVSSLDVSSISFYNSCLK